MPSPDAPCCRPPGTPACLLSAAPSSLRRPSPPRAVRRRRGPGRRAPGLHRSARARAADRDGLLNTLLAAMGNDRKEEEDTQEAGQRQNRARWIRPMVTATRTWRLWPRSPRSMPRPCSPSPASPDLQPCMLPGTLQVQARRRGGAQTAA
ncbi:hypothetical protein VPH35_029955 [Triticum aestivum]